jgi:hypothetical protein
MDSVLARRKRRRLREFLVVAAAAAVCVTGTLPLADHSAAAGARAAQGGSNYITAVRIGHHPTYDRLVLTFHGRVPTHTVRYVKTVRADASGKVIKLLGKAKLRIVIRPTLASASEPQGTWTPRFPEIRQVKGAGNVEGVTSYGVGLAAHRPFHVFTLTAPSRLVIDVRLPAA